MINQNYPDERSIQEAAMRQVEQIHSSRIEGTLIVVPVVVEKEKVVVVEKENTVVVEKEKKADEGHWLPFLFLALGLIGILVAVVSIFVDVTMLKVAVVFSFSCFVLSFVLSLIFP
jgi:hypothetical protein